MLKKSPAWLSTEPTNRASLTHERGSEPDSSAALETSALNALLEARLGLNSSHEAIEMDSDSTSDDENEQTVFPLFFGSGPVSIVEPAAEDVSANQGRKDQAWEVTSEEESRLQSEFESIAVNGLSVLEGAKESWGHLYAKRIIVVPLVQPKARRKPRLRKNSRLIKRKKLKAKAKRDTKRAAGKQKDTPAT